MNIKCIVLAAAAFMAVAGSASADSLSDMLDRQNQQRQQGEMERTRNEMEWRYWDQQRQQADIEMRLNAIESQRSFDRLNDRTDSLGRRH